MRGLVISISSERAPITVLLVDDHSLVRKSFRRLLEDEADVDVVGEAKDGHSAVESALHLRPKVVVMDFALPDLMGGAAAQEILKDLPDTAILIVSMYSEPVYVRAALDVGARGYLLKSATLDLAAAVRAAASGQLVLDPEIPAPSSASGEPVRPLTERKLEVLRLAASGKSNKEIARELGISEGTAAVHRANIMTELSVNKVAKMSLYALARGLIEYKPRKSREIPDADKKNRLPKKK